MKAEGLKTLCHILNHKSIEVLAYRQTVEKSLSPHLKQPLCLPVSRATVADELIGIGATVSVEVAGSVVTASAEVEAIGTTVSVDATEIVAADPIMIICADCVDVEEVAASPTTVSPVVVTDAGSSSMAFNVWAGTKPVSKRRAIRAEVSPIVEFARSD